MTGPPAATAAVRVAVRRALANVSGPVAAAVSGGADSLALAAALAFERTGSYALVVDHDLQPGSHAVAERAAEQCRSLGLDAHVLASLSGEPVGGGSGIGGPEAAARALRHGLLADAAERLGVAAVLLAHTLDDQAETVLLGLARGSGSRALAGMPTARGVFLRPLLAVSHETTAKACAEAGLVPWDDPHNADPRYARVRVRSVVLPVLERELGPGMTQALVRSAAQLREDADALDVLTPVLPDEPSVADLLALPGALRSRALKRWAERLCGRAVNSAHVTAIRTLVEDWSGQGPVSLPGRTCVSRIGSHLVAVPPR